VPADRTQQNAQAAAEDIKMGKERKSNKEVKKKATMTPKEKKASKKSKQDSKKDIFSCISSDQI
jgi:hypothetical protein